MPDLSESKVVEYMGKFVNAGYYFGYFPYSWDPKNRRMVYNGTNKRWHWFMFQLQCVFLIGYDFFIIIRSVQTFQKKEATVRHKMVVIYKLMGFFLACVFPIHTTISYGSLHDVVNNFLRIRQSFSDKRVKQCIAAKDKRSNKNAVRMMKLLTFLVIILGTTYVPACVFKPTSPEFLTSVATNPKQLPLWERLLIGIIHGNTTSFAAYGFFVYAVMCICYMQNILSVVKELGSCGTPPTMLKTDLSRYHHQLAVIQQYFNVIFSPWAFWFEVILIELAIGNLLQSILYGSIRALVASTGLILVTMYVFRKLGKVHELTKEMYASWNRLISNEVWNESNSKLKMKMKNNSILKNWGRKWFTAYLKSCRPLNVMVGSFYYADPRLVLTLLGIILNNTISLAFTFRVYYPREE